MDSIKKLLQKSDLDILRYIYKNLYPEEKNNHLVFHLANEFFSKTTDFDNLKKSYKKLSAQLEIIVNEKIKSPQFQSSDYELLKDQFLAQLEQALNITQIENQFEVTHLDQPLKARRTFPLKIILHNVRSAFNVGSIIRTCEGLGVEEIFFTGYTVGPSFKPLKKTSLNAQKYIKWQSEENIFKIIIHLKKNNIPISAFETSKKAKPFNSQTPLMGPQCFIFGNEKYGLEAQILDQVHEIYEIPMWGVKNSLNVANAASIACALAREKLINRA